VAVVAQPKGGMDMPIMWNNGMAQTSVRQKSRDIAVLEVFECGYCCEITPIDSLSYDESGLKVCPFCLK
jgi:hypothetical protein